MKKLILLCFLACILTVDIDRAVQYLISHAEPQSVGLCAGYVAAALQAGGFVFTPQASAYMYRTNGILTGMGYKLIPKPASFKKGDITVTDRNYAHEHGHMAMWSGTNWISDFVQNSEYVYANDQPPVYYYRYGKNTPTDDIIFTYAVRTQGKKILPEVVNTNDYAGIQGIPITDVAIKVNKGTVKYRVHVRGGNWLNYVTGYNWNDSKNGYSGNMKPIDCVQIIYNGKTEMPLYRVSPLSKDYYDWQKGSKTGGGYDGYAGAMGKVIDRLQISPY